MMPADRSPKISPPKSMGVFRAVVIIFAVLLACQAFWILAPELSRAPLIGFPHDKASVDVRTAVDARNATERALLFAPHNARIWLALANLDSKFDGLNEKASAALRMYFYTRPSEGALLPARLQLALSLPAISDKDFQQLVAHDLRTIVTRRPELKPAISNAYQNASPEGQQFIRDALKDLDPNFLSTLPQKRRGD